MDIIDFYKGILLGRLEDKKDSQLQISTKLKGDWEKGIVSDATEHL